MQQNKKQNGLTFLMSRNTKSRSNANLKNIQTTPCINVNMHKCKPEHNHPNLILSFQRVHLHRWETPHLEFQEYLLQHHRSLLDVLAM